MQKPAQGVDLLQILLCNKSASKSTPVGVDYIMGINLQQMRPLWTYPMQNLQKGCSEIRTTNLYLLWIMQKNCFKIHCSRFYIRCTGNPKQVPQQYIFIAALLWEKATIDLCSVATYWLNVDSKICSKGSISWWENLEHLNEICARRFNLHACTVICCSNSTIVM